MTMSGMAKSEALFKLLESADLLRMVEDLAASGAYEKLSAPGLAGFKITLRTIRENILASHDQLASHFLEQARNGMEAESQRDTEISDRPLMQNAANQSTVTQHTAGANTATQTTVMTTTPPLAAMMQARQQAAASQDSAAGQQPQPARTTIISDPQRLQMMRKDLRASIEKMVETR